MTAILRRLDSLTGESFTDCLGKVKTSSEFSNEWSKFSDALPEKDTGFFEPLVRKHAVLNLEYSVLCTRLAHTFTRKKTERSEFSKQEVEELTRQIITALVMSELLTHIYAHYLDVPREVMRLQNEQEVYRILLEMRGYKVRNKIASKVDNPYAIPQKIRGTAMDLNWIRLFSIRTRRLLMTLVPVLKNVELYGNVMSSIDWIAAPIFNHIAWIYYLFRLSANLYQLGEYFWMNRSKRDAHFFRQLIALLELDNRWFEIGNDITWLLTGILCCYLLTGSLTGIGMYLTVGTFFFDVLWASTRAAVELSRIKKEQEEFAVIFQTLLEKRDLPGMDLESQIELELEIADAKEHQNFLQRRYDYEQKKLLLNVLSTSLLFLAMCTALPILALNPYLIFLGALIVLLVTLATFLTTTYLEKQRPVDKVIGLEKEPLFAKSRYVMFQREQSESEVPETDSIVLANIPSSYSAPDLNILDNPLSTSGVF